MKRTQHQNGSGNLIWNFFASVNLTIVILISLAASSIIGTIVPQNGKPDFYFHKYGEVLYRVFSTLDIFDMYRSWWFRFLIILLVINIIICSINKLSTTWKIIFPGKPLFRKNKFKNSSPRNEFITTTSPEKLKALFQKVIGKRYRHVEWETLETGFLLFAEKGRWTRLGVYAVHFSVVLLLTGSLLGSLFGFDGSVTIAEGEQTGQILLRDSDLVLNLDFQIRCDDFSVSFYDSGAPKEFRSALTLLKDGKPVITKDIIVNDPLRYEGINLFQSSYGKLPPRNITLVLRAGKTGDEIVRKTVQLGEKIPLPDHQGEFVLNDFSHQFHFKGKNLGDAFTGSLFLKDKGAIDVVIPYPFPRIDIHSPAEIEKINAFQIQSMGTLPDRISLSVTSRNSGIVYTINTAIGETHDIPEGLGRFTLEKFERSYDFKGHNIGETLIGKLQEADGKKQEIILPLRFSQFDRMRKGNTAIAVADLQQQPVQSDIIVSVADFQEHYYTGLQVTKDPGVWVVYSGFLLMILGCYITFFPAHQQICIEAVRKGDQTVINIMGTANKNAMSLQRKLETLSAQLNRLSV
ncbi:MAG: cytochrome c biogenesis protein ResB [Desulfobacteraceae bacterium]|nr:MAG: cytochrome c biogenesis protein ResB [Desulfobacteraceae bacterium]